MLAVLFHSTRKSALKNIVQFKFEFFLKKQYNRAEKTLPKYNSGEKVKLINEAENLIINH